jgi:hypothetical protein
LCGFPGDTREIYEETLHLARLIHHLPPPTALWHLTIDRFSPYFMRPGDFAVANVTPYPAYADVFPRSAPTAQLAYHFVGEYESAADQYPDLMRALGEDLAHWRRAWSRRYGARPELKIEPRGDGTFLLVDTRGLPGTTGTVALHRDEAAFLVTHRLYGQTADEDRAIANQLAVAVDGWFVPLPVARIDAMFDLLEDSGDAAAQRSQLAQLAVRRNGGDVRDTLVQISCSGALSALDHPLAPE